MVFIASRGFFADEDIVVFIKCVFQAVFCGKIYAKCADFIGISRTVRNGADFFKIMKHALRRKAFKHVETSSY